VLPATQVVEAQEDAILTKDGERIPADLMVWAAGVKAPAFLANIGGLETNRGNQLVVRETLQTSRDHRILAIGDCAFLLPEGAERPIPPRAQSANQMADRAASNVIAAISGKPMKKFIYNDKGSLVSLARYQTVGSLMGNLVGGRMAIEGRLARLVYTSLYRLHLIAIHGWWKGMSLMMVGHVNQVVRPRLKLH
jgi:NADH dehydrogenase